MQWKLNYKEPAGSWTESLPLGNGELGVMWAGSAGCDRIELNLDTLWSGTRQEEAGYGELPDWKGLRQMIAEGKLGEAEKYAQEHILGDWTAGYLPAGSLLIDFCRGKEGDITDYRRELSLNDAVQVASWKAGEVSYGKEMFVSMADPVFAVRVQVGKNETVEAEISLESQLRYETNVLGDKDGLELCGYAPVYAAPNYYKCETPIRYEEGKGTRFCIKLAVALSAGTVQAEGKRLKVTAQEDFYIFLTAATDFYGGADWQEKMTDVLAYAKKEGYGELKRKHLEAYRPIFNRVELQFEETDFGKADTMHCLRHFGEGAVDRNFMALLFHYARYLLICSSKPGTQAANLQGIWNREVRPPWSSNYTVNINTQMNYWMAESCGLSEFHMPLFDLIDTTAQKGKDTAKRLYGLEGWVSHHNLDVWGHSGPVGKYAQDEAPCAYALWPMSSGWLCRHLWEHYCYTLDKDFLETRAYPVIREAVRFYLGYLTEYDEFLVTSPSTSPENVFYGKDGEKHSVSMASAMDISILKDLFGNYLEICRILGKEEWKRETEEAWKKLPPFQIGKAGQLQEWYEDYEETDIHHRHVSHLYGLYPANLFPGDTQEGVALRRACEKTLERRGDDGTGWCMAWKASLWARLKNGDKALALLKNQMRLTFEEKLALSGGGIYPNLFCAHPPFQIDGNFGFAAAVTEMLLQSQDGRIELLPALPGEWKDGQAKGLKARGGYTVDVAWKNGGVTAFRICAIAPGEVEVLYGGKKQRLRFEEGKGLSWQMGEESVALHFAPCYNQTTQ